MNRNAQIISTAYYVPEKIVSNSFFNELYHEDVDTWLRENLTIQERRWCSETESTADLCEQAAKKVLFQANISPDDIDLIIVATDTPEFISPSTASVLQHRLNAKNAATFDLNSACAGYVTGLITASMYIRGSYKINTVLVIGAYAMSKFLDIADKKTATLFADGAGATLLTSTDENGIGLLGFDLRTQGMYNDWMGIYGGGTKTPSTTETVIAKEHLLKFVKKFPKELNPEIWSEMIRGTAEGAGVSVLDIQHFIFTQININSIRQTLDKLQVEYEKTYTIMEKYGYTGSACIPMALATAEEQGVLKPGDYLMVMGSGGGLAFANALFKL